jgi:hypothetical protein
MTFNPAIRTGSFEFRHLSDKPLLNFGITHVFLPILLPRITPSTNLNPITDRVTKQGLLSLADQLKTLSLPWVQNVNTKHWRKFTSACTKDGPEWCRRCSNSLRPGRSGDRIPEEERLFTPVKTGPGAQIAFYAIGNGSFPGVKRPRRDVDHPPPYNTEIKKEQSYTFTPPLGFRGLF